MATETNRLYTIVVLGLVIGSASRANADFCAFPLPPDAAQHAMDNFVWSYWACNPAIWQEFDSKFQMASGENWEDYGLAQRCNLDLPYARTTNAMFLVRNASPSYSAGTGRLNGGYAFLQYGTPRLSAGCDCDCTADHTQALWPFVNERTRVYKAFFYERTVSHRAAILIHEARHRDKLHNAGSNCGSGKSCDSEFSYMGANTYHIQWLSDYEVWGTIKNADTALDSDIWADYLLDIRFQLVPDLKHEPGVGLVRRCYPNCHTCAETGRCGTYPYCKVCGTECLTSPQEAQIETSQHPSTELTPPSSDALIGPDC